MWTRRRARRQNESSSSASGATLGPWTWSRSESGRWMEEPELLWGTKEPALFTCWKMPRLLRLTVRRNLAHAFCILNASCERRRLLINFSAGRYKFVWLIATARGNGSGEWRMVLGTGMVMGVRMPGQGIPRNTLSAAIKRAVGQSNDLMYDFFQIISTWLWVSLISLARIPASSLGQALKENSKYSKLYYFLQYKKVSSQG